MTQPSYGPLPGPSYELLGDLRRNAASRLSLQELDDYYRGEQRLAYLSPTSQHRLRQLVVNLPRLVVDSLEDRLDVEGFRMGGTPDADAELWRVWQANDLDEWSQQCHLDALVHGRSFVLVWADTQDDRTPRITVESATQMSVQYDPASRRVTRAVKRWSEGGEQFATVYTENAVLRYAAPIGVKDEELTRWRMRERPITNPMGAVPVVPFINRPRLSRPLGESEMIDVLPVADAINKLATDMMVSAEYHAMPRRWATGVDLGGNDDEAERTREKARENWTNAEAGRVWLSDSDKAAFGQFAEAQLDNFIGAIDMLTARAAALSGLPPHYFGQAGENPTSADALRSSEASLVKRALRKQRVFGGAWERVMRLALLVRDGAVPNEAKSMETIWASPETPTVAQKADAAVKLTQSDVITVDQALEDLGYTPEQRRRMQEQRDASLLGSVRVQLDEARRLQQQDGLSQQAAFAAVGLLQAASAIGSTGA